MKDFMELSPWSAFQLTLNRRLNPCDGVGEESRKENGNANRFRMDQELRQMDNERLIAPKYKPRQPS